MKRVLVTGATGFIGKPCLEFLKERDFEIYALSSSSIPKDSKDINWYQINLHDISAVKELLLKVRPTHLLHLAWYVKHGAFWTSEENIKWVSTSLNLVEQFIDNGGQKVVCIGTCAEYDWSDESTSKDLSEESTAIKPRTLYGASKAGLYMILKVLCQLKNVELAWGRLFFPYGPYESPERLIPNTVSRLLNGEMTVCKHPDLKRDFVFVQDIAKIMASLVDSHFVGPINIASGQAICLGDVVNTIAKLLGTENLVQYGSHEKSNDPAFIVGDIAKLKSELGFNKWVDLKEGLEETIDWWKIRINNSVYIT